ncbi:MAG TPA: winged helix-turn-helix domain-containing protein [Blastocatellia bacterium]|nr:winged helix-turn-helix domain-containing protein [Blastocatellia bacterium]
MSIKVARGLDARSRDCYTFILMEPDPNQYDTIAFGPFELLLQSGELLRDGETVKLSPQPFKVLWFLAENDGRLVGRKELQEKIWGTETFVDFDKGLNLCIAQIREALGDDAQAPRFIETLPRRGYRFIAKVEKRTAPVSAPDAARPITGPETNQPPGGQDSTSGKDSDRRILGMKRTPFFFIAAIVVLMAVWIVVEYLPVPQSRSRSAASAAKAMLLVLPFENLTNDPSQDYFSDGLTEEMITTLGSLQPKRLGVIARTTALTYKKSGKDIRQIGRELGVSYVLEGSVRREAGRLRITSQLIQVDDQTHLWAETYDRNETDVLNIQRDVALRVASSLSFELLPSSYSEVAAARTTRPEAYDAYLKGRYLITKDNLQDLERSIPYFDRALAEDPNFAPAYAAQVEALVLISDWTGRSTDSNVAKAKAAALKAVEVNPAYAESYAALGSVNFWLEWNWADAEANLKRALEINPNNPLTHVRYGEYLFARGRAEEGASEINEAVKLDPVSLLTTGLSAFAQLHAGRYDEAIALSYRMLELEPKSPAAHECLFRAYVGQNKYAQAVDITERRLSLSGSKRPDGETRARANPKDFIEAHFREDLAQMEAAAKKGERVWDMYLAWLYTRAGRKDQAFECLEKALTERAAFLVYLNVDPLWDSLRSDPRFGHLNRLTAW